MAVRSKLMSKALKQVDEADILASKVSSDLKSVVIDQFIKRKNFLLEKEANEVDV